MSWPARSHYSGHVTEDLIGQTVSLCGWVDRTRNHGGVVFIDVRDHTGIVQVCSSSPRPRCMLRLPLSVHSPHPPPLLTQVVGIEDEHPAVHAALEDLRLEYVVHVVGTPRLRQEPNPRIPTGKLEIVATHVEVRPPVPSRLLHSLRLRPS